MIARVPQDTAHAAQAYRRGLWVHTTLADSLRTAAADSPQRIVVVDKGIRLDCATLYTQASALAAAMMSRMPTGSVVSFMLPNWYETAVIYLAATLAGMVVNPILPSLRDHDLHFILEDAETAMIFVPHQYGGHDYAAMLERVTTTMSPAPTVVVLRGSENGQAGSYTPYRLLLERPLGSATLPALDPDSVRMILYTSGTTSRPKGVLHTHNSIHALICQISDHWMIAPGDTFLVPSPVAHIGGSIYAFECPLLLGTAAILMDRWEPSQAVALMASERCTHIAGATPFLQQLLAAAERAGTRLPDLKVFICGGASVSPSLIRCATEYFEHAVVTRVYGCTEVPVATVGAPRPPEADHAADTDGRPGIAEIKLVPHESAPAGDGEICVRGPQMLLGYRHRKDGADSFDAAGFFRTGDLGRWVDDGYLVVTGRAKDIIVRSGENISAKEVEDLLADHPGIAEIAVVGLPDERTGERACAVIVPAGAASPDVASLLALLVSKGVAKFKAPERVVIWDALPKNDAGKILKHQIRAVLTQDG
ncbi:AMP-binding protein [Mycobacterium montefiorense]|uniref:Cyclohexanecarboxylate-CoA ligase n=1 Tax=Mycobacterium montefiorense TaxID=154654 RepID=A0AA37PQ30_9MYCO|nr:AMP-binding protein [Mycobacterium montefiorense]GBG37812.1 cyclohexanecarboxylate-CoA ligase [Mycobacterium montefiorense]GKU34950.1 cyclohexanecarboxylate-CoA ligase [Mycobacterium montefiorense]GKU40963.1 cyclohexanecarboxylate-CoA ligase [Mycobacterium montefiorense]GKU47072.1 cyclohexanecarboxylate-CoA ligase [Mycobacterium montefiorense]GKU49192.1 cyclohexanecarboxylate-CoA ligase [Mycobacterium montefiorense]